ncbi:MAG: RNA polymerase sigma factor [Kofleriaceae bacterium]|nr:RNA polymerase sigma factor [Kofleriaceae bacterium]
MCLDLLCSVKFLAESSKPFGDSGVYMDMTAKTQAQAATLLVNRAKAGDRAAFEELVRRYRPRILALALHLSGNESEAEDITQEVFFKAYQKLQSFEGRSHFFTWVYRMTVNRSLNARRDKKRRREETLDDPRISRALQVDAGGDPVKAAELRATYVRLLQALDALPTSMRTSVVLVVLQGLSHAEAAVVQSCSSGTVAWHIHEARVRLRSTMERAVSRKARKRGLSSELTNLLQDWLLPCPQIN